VSNPLSWEYLKVVPGPNEVFGPLAILYLAIFVIGFIFSLVIYNNQGKQLFCNPAMFNLFRRWSGWASFVFGAGLFFFLIRALQINPFTFAMRFWMWVTLAGLGVIFVLMILDYRKNYKRELADWERRKQREAHLKPLTTVGNRKQAQAAIAASSGRPVKRKRRT